jgi:hypothetical protein
VYLEIEQLVCFDTNSLFLDYITTKYRCLKKLALVFELKYNRFSFSKYYNAFDTSSFTGRNFENIEDDMLEPKIQGIAPKKKKK